MTKFQDIQSLLQNRQPLPPLFPTQVWQPELSRQIQNLSDDELFGSSGLASEQQVSQQRAACRAGLLLWNDDLDASHTISQSINSSTGSFWHAIMHRREGDLSNSRYWWHKTGTHPTFANIYIRVLETLENESEADAKEFLRVLENRKQWQPNDFVACCGQAQQSGRDSEWRQRVQVIEMAELLHW